MTHEHNHDEQEYITLVDDQGNESLYEILFTFDSEDFGKSYVLVYPAGSSEADEEVEIQAYSYEESDEGVSGNLSPIETDAEWDMIEEVLNTFLAEDQE